MTAQQLNNFLIDQGIDHQAISILDAHYALPSPRWLVGAFADGFLKVRAQFELPAWEADLADCDDFAGLAVFYASFLHRNELALQFRAARETEQEPPALSALAFGTFIYSDRRPEVGCHCINVAIVGDLQRGEMLLFFFEPQTGKQVDLSPEEICSCQEIRL